LDNSFTRCSNRQTITKEGSMRSVRQLAVVILGITCLVAGQALDTHAKPRQSTAFGCTIDDLQTNFAGSCIKQADQDIINGNSYIHVVICEAGQRGRSR
jgi:hypothetical protein